MGKSISQAKDWPFIGLLIALAGPLLDATVSYDSPRSRWVYPGPDGKLVYRTTPAGDRIMDFSHAGYMGGGVALPNVPVKRTVKPSGNNDDNPLRTSGFPTAWCVSRAISAIG